MKLDVHYYALGIMGDLEEGLIHTIMRFARWWQQASLCLYFDLHDLDLGFFTVLVTTCTYDQ